MGEVKAVGYGPDGPLPRFSIRGWDDGTVYVDVMCVCGRNVYDDDRPLNNEAGVLEIRCHDCGRTYRVSVLGAMVEPDAS